ARESVRHCQSLDYPAFEILLLPDEPPDTAFPGVRVIPTGPVGPSEKRDLALNHASGEILAFIDDDAYPAKSWLKEAVKHFQDDNVAAVGGPAVTPPDDSLLRRASGFVLSSFMGSASMVLRYVPRKERTVDDCPSCNFLIRKSVFRELGGFNSLFWPGEDTKLCLEITHRLHKEIIYDPRVLVYHHRRKLFGPHLKQVWRYAVHRGYFAKKFPETSRRVSYLLPSIFFLGVIFGLPASFLNPMLRTVFLTVVSLYLGLALLSSLPARDIRAVPLVFSGIVATHLTYGAGFLRGLLTRRLAR
ncbi:MAG: glycosyltransferase, partial [Chloroflexi bacterium]|nr:glycosyltransferase [Chloroflexota bacterium]